jgi:hypothetical protein
MLVRPKNYRTVPCRNYHGPGNQGCARGEFCHFIHDPDYLGMDIPKEVLMKHRKDNNEKYHNYPTTQSIIS